MSTKILVEKSTMTGIAEAIRAKTGLSESFKPADMILEIEENIPEAIPDYLEYYFNGTLSSYTNSNVNTLKASAFANNKSITTIKLENCTNIGSYAFWACSNLKTISFPNCTTIGSSAFGFCSRLTKLSFPNAKYIYSNAFYSVYNVTSLSFPECITLGAFPFQGMYKVTKAYFPKCVNVGSSAFNSLSISELSIPATNYISAYAFAYCAKLTSLRLSTTGSIYSYAFNACGLLSTLILAGSSVPTLMYSNALNATPIANSKSTGYIYVPSSLIASYQAAANWSYFKYRFSAIEDME